MLKEERHQYIINRINKDNRIYVTELSVELEVSDDTIRRDLVELENQGLLTKVHGGAITKSEISMVFTERLSTAVLMKQQMAAKLIPMFKEGDVILLDGGTSNLEVARQIPKNMPLTIYTNSFPIVNELVDCSKLKLIFLGGEVFAASQVTVGLSVYRELQSITFDWIILGISDIHPEKGLTCPDREEAMIKRCMIKRGKKRVVLADSYKLDTARTYHVASLAEMDYIITENSKIDYIKQQWPSYSYKVI